MGKVIVKLKLTNLFNLGMQHRKLSTAKPRSIEVDGWWTPEPRGSTSGRVSSRRLGSRKWTK